MPSRERDCREKVSFGAIEPYNLLSSANRKKSDIIKDNIKYNT